jgi:hypothetical protein
MLKNFLLLYLNLLILLIMYLLIIILKILHSILVLIEIDIDNVLHRVTGKMEILNKLES